MFAVRYVDFCPATVSVSRLQQWCGNQEEGKFLKQNVTYATKMLLLEHFELVKTSGEPFDIACGTFDFLLNGSCIMRSNKSFAVKHFWMNWTRLRDCLNSAYTWHQGQLGWITSQTCHWGPPCFHLWNPSRCIFVWLVKWTATVCCSSVPFIMVARHFSAVTHPDHSQIEKLELCGWSFWERNWKKLRDIMKVSTRSVTPTRANRVVIWQEK